MRFISIESGFTVAKSSSLLHVFLLILVTCLIGLARPAQAQERTFFEVLSDEINKSTTQPLDSTNTLDSSGNLPSGTFTASPQPTSSRTSLDRHRSIINGMNAFRGAPDALKDLVAQQLVRLEGNGSVTIPPKDPWKDPMLQQVGIQPILQALNRVNGRTYKSALVVLAWSFGRNPNIDPATKQQVVDALKDVAKESWQIGERHQFMAFHSLFGLMPFADFKPFITDFIETHKKGPHWQIQELLLSNALEQLQIIRRVNSVRVTSNPGSSIFSNGR